VPTSTSYRPANRAYGAIGASAEEERQLDEILTRLHDQVRALRDEVKAGRLGRAEFLDRVFKADDENDEAIIKAVGPDRGKRLLDVLEQEGEQLVANLPESSDSH
jgi:hypothetical protein